MPTFEPQIQKHELIIINADNQRTTANIAYMLILYMADASPIFSIYSILYWYFYYSTLCNISVKIITIRCRPIQFNALELRFVHVHSFFRK